MGKKAQIDLGITGFPIEKLFYYFESFSALN